jgi:hypothetical protein
MSKESRARAVGPNNSLKPKHLRGSATSLYIVGFTAGYRIFGLLSKSMRARGKQLATCLPIEDRLRLA